MVLENEYLERMVPIRKNGIPDIVKQMNTWLSI